MTPSDPFGSDDLLRLVTAVPIDDLTPGGEDTWIVVEAGLPLIAAADLEDDDGVLDTTDNNGDGVIDRLDDIGEYREPRRPAADDRRFHLYMIAPGTYPTAFTNPMLIDRAGDGWEPPGL